MSGAGWQQVAGSAEEAAVIVAESSDDSSESLDDPRLDSKLRGGQHSSRRLAASSLLLLLGVVLLVSLLVFVLPWRVLQLSPPAAARPDRPRHAALWPRPRVSAAEAAQREEQRSSYNESEAKLFVSYAQAVFCQREKLENWACGKFCERVPVVPGAVRYLGPGISHGVQGYVAQVPWDAPLCMVAFRGSVNKANWEADFEAWLVDWPPAAWGGKRCYGCKVHRGFADAYAELRQQMAEAVTALGCKRLAFTGHSLGASVTTLAALDSRLHGYAVAKMYTFGSPHVGNTAFVRTFAEMAALQRVDPPSWRIVHFHDPIPRLRSPFQDYQQVPREVYYNANSSEYRVCSDTVTIDPTCMSSVPLRQCVGMDHISYLGHNFQVDSMPEECTGKAPA
eukprot:TRINITY_DN25356_c0_g1_i1.p1 TRINITY_DN25356_c0_g1~~TRINITY_DN25356_c0_g1_i1.p1  ORF type:complete len:394 (-),score=73.49 TRINITY_DN25356_c0_g1_i1:344-1525(-)